MKIAVTYENGRIFPHFGHTAQFMLYQTEGDRIVSKTLVDTNGSGHGALAGLLVSLGAEVLICGGIGGGAQTALAQAGIRLFGGVSGSADDAVNAFLGKTLVFDPHVQCSHHDGAHAHGSHTCSDHGCGGTCK